MAVPKTTLSTGMRKLLLLLCLALGLTACSAEKHLADSPANARRAYQHRQRLHLRERPRRLADRYWHGTSW